MDPAHGFCERAAAAGCCRLTPPIDGGADGGGRAPPTAARRISSMMGTSAPRAAALLRSLPSASLARVRGSTAGEATAPHPRSARGTRERLFRCSNVGFFVSFDVGVRFVSGRRGRARVVGEGCGARGARARVWSRGEERVRRHDRGGGRAPTDRAAAAVRPSRSPAAENHPLARRRRQLPTAGPPVPSNSSEMRSTHTHPNIGDHLGRRPRMRAGIFWGATLAPAACEHCAI
jgi:hypothetical protein